MNENVAFVLLVAAGLLFGFGITRCTIERNHDEVRIECLKTKSPQECGGLFK